MPVMIIPADTNTKAKCLSVIKRYLPDVTDTDFRNPVQLNYCTYIWTCACGYELVYGHAYEPTDIWSGILRHLTTSRHNDLIRARDIQVLERFHQYDAELCPANLEELEPKIHKLKVQLELLRKWIW